MARRSNQALNRSVFHLTQQSHHARLSLERCLGRAIELDVMRFKSCGLGMFVLLFRAAPSHSEAATAAAACMVSGDDAWSTGRVSRCARPVPAALDAPAATPASLLLESIHVSASRYQAESWRRSPDARVCAHTVVRRGPDRCVSTHVVERCVPWDRLRAAVA